jgi:formylglycine-generating enzyme required for sulfatase activity
MKIWKSKRLWFYVALLLIITGIFIARATILKSSSLDEQTQLVRRLAAVNDPELADVLDQSLITIPAGNFFRGSDTGRSDENPRQMVYLDSYEIDRYEVTNIQYSRFLVATGGKAPSYWTDGKYPVEQADYPVVGISWKDADAYCAWTGKRLPTEAEWEKACSGPDGNLYPWGNQWDSQRTNVDYVTEPISSPGQAGSPTAWAYAWKLLQTTPTANQLGLRPIGSYPDGASPYGIMDLVGNASEWVFDWYNWGDYSQMPTRNPVNLEPKWNHSVRGSAWHDPVGDIEHIPTRSRCSARGSAHSAADPRIGFRCARSVPDGG